MDGRSLDLPLQYLSEMERHGFTNVAEHVYRIPLNTEQPMTQQSVVVSWADGFEAYSMDLLDKHLGKRHLEVFLICAAARQALRKGVEGWLEIASVKFSSISLYEFKKAKAMHISQAPPVSLSYPLESIEKSGDAPVIYYMLSRNGPQLASHTWKSYKRTENDRAQGGNDGKFWSELSSFFGLGPATTGTLEADAPPYVFGTSRIAE
ncbi:hypothetical protein AnigIFM59636_011345 [Aspergillus niger]|nr:hypothetical protein AnigIFM59636_011345 [Aspergillus niger]